VDSITKENFLAHKRLCLSSRFLIKYKISTVRPLSVCSKMSTTGTVSKRFKGSDMEKELEALYKNGLIDQTTTAKEAYEMSLVFKRDITFDKFSPKYYNWKRKKSFSEEAERNGGYGPPEGKLIFFVYRWQNFN